MICCNSYFIEAALLQTDYGQAGSRSCEISHISSAVRDSIHVPWAVITTRSLPIQRLFLLNLRFLPAVAIRWFHWKLLPSSPPGQSKTPHGPKMTYCLPSCLQSIGVDYIDRDCPPHNSGSHHMPNRTRMTDSPLSCLQSIIRDLIDRDCLLQTQALTERGIEPRWLPGILLARPMCDQRPLSLKKGCEETN